RSTGTWMGGCSSSATPIRSRISRSTATRTSRPRAASSSSRIRPCAPGSTAWRPSLGISRSMPDRLRRFWDFDDLDGTEQRFREQLDREPDAGRMTEWTERGLALAEDEPDAAYWAGPLLNNLGWQHFEAGDYEAALGAFEPALEVRERDPTNADAIAFAREAVETARQALGR